MKIFLSFLFVLALVSIGFCQDYDVVTLPQSKRFVDWKMHAQVDCPLTWNMDVLTNNAKVFIAPVSEDDTIAVALTTFLADSPVTAEEVSKRRAGSKWDRWHVLGTKGADDKGLKLSNADDKLSVLLFDSEVGDDQQLIETYVAEDIYVKNSSAVYIVTAMAEKSKWFCYKDTIKDILKSFQIVGD